MIWWCTIHESRVHRNTPTANAACEQALVYAYRTGTRMQPCPAGFVQVQIVEVDDEGR